MAIATDWQPTTDHELQARTLGLDLEAEADAFREYNRSTVVRHPNGAFAGWLRRSTRKVEITGAPPKRDGYRMPPPTQPIDPVGADVGRWIEENPERAEEIRISLEERARDEGRTGWAATAWVAAELRARVIEILDREHE